MNMTIEHTTSRQVHGIGEQRMLDIAMQWRDLAASTRLPNLRPLYLNAARAVEMQVIRQVSEHSAVQ
jgi:hypothetical protein